MKIIDTHCHLDDPQFAEDLDSVVQRAKDAGVYKVLLASVSMFETEKMLAVEAAYPGFCYAMVGVHPQEVNAENYKVQMELFDREIERRPYIAVGEIGIDLYWDRALVRNRRWSSVIRWQPPWSVGSPYQYTHVTLLSLQ